MTNENRTENRDEVLFAFHQAYARPNAEQIIEWTSKYPQFAEDIRAHAVVAWDWACEGELAAEADESLVAEGYSRALNIIWQAASAAPIPNVSTVRSFQDILAARGITVPQVARTIGIERGVVADLVSGRMLVPAGPRFVNAFSDAAAISPAEFHAAHQYAVSAPRVGLAKADRAPAVVQQTYEQIIRATVAADRQSFWLEGD
jgi:uncharacterized protein YunC (DUF1805 family)